MIYATNPTQPKTVTAKTAAVPQEGMTMEQEMHLEQLKHSAEGVLFHTYQRDAYSVLGLNGFKNFHDKRVCKETESLDKSKDHYISRNGIMPVFKVEENFWKDSNKITSKLERDEIGQTVQKLMEELLNWENDGLDLLMHLKGKSKDKKKYYTMIQGQIQELDFLECVDKVLNQYGYSYEAVQEMDSYLKTK